MMVKDVRRLAVALGIGDANRMNTAELIRFIQFQEGDMPCFSEAWSVPCNIRTCPVCEDCSSNFHCGKMGGVL